MLPLTVGLAVLALCGLAIVGSWQPVARLVGVRRERLGGLLPVLVAVYIAGAFVVAWAWARFDARRAALRVPIVLVFGAAGIFVALVAVWLGGVGGDSPGSGPGGGGTPGGVGSGAAAIAPVSLAAALVDSNDAEAILGAPVATAEVHARWLQRGASLCRYHALDRSATLSVMIREAPRSCAEQRLVRRGDPIPGLGDLAIALPTGVWVLSGAWVLSLAVRRRERRREDRPALIDAARAAVGRLPTSAGS